MNNQDVEAKQSSDELSEQALNPSDSESQEIEASESTMEEENEAKHDDDENSDELYDDDYISYTNIVELPSVSISLSGGR